MVRSWRPAAVTACMAAIFFGCSPEPQPFEETALETEIVGGGVDAELSTDEDRKGKALVRSGGVLPGDFPNDLPLPSEYTVVDLSQGVDLEGDQDDREARYLVVQTTDPEPAVREDLAGRLSALGWSVEERADGFAITREGRRVQWILSDTKPGTRIEIRY
ncbi:MAG: hypothetical protein OES47_06470 [Acidobacteriota bacterium]|nr:hypothetical protein [Acidobacteriota bacterium]